MYRVLRIGFIFLCCVHMAISVVKVDKNTSSSIKKSVQRKTTHHYRLQYYRPGQSYVRKFLALHSEIAQLVATYVGRETFPTTMAECDGIQERGASVRSTKSTTSRVTTTRRYPTVSRKERRQIFYLRLLNIFSEFDNEKKEFLTSTESPPHKASTCYMEAYSSFMNHCFYDHFYRNTGMNYIKNLLARACMARWLSAKKIIRILENCCGKRFKFVPL